MAVKHIVWIRGKPAVSEKEMEKLLASIKSLQSFISGVLEVSAGKNFTDRANGYTHGVIITLADKQALSDYIVHPKHVEVVSVLRTISDTMVLDYET